MFLKFTKPIALVFDETGLKHFYLIIKFFTQSETNVNKKFNGPTLNLINLSLKHDSNYTL